MSQKSVVDMLGSIDPAADDPDFKALISGRFYLFKKNDRLVLYAAENSRDLKFIADLGKFNRILRFDWNIETLAVGNIDSPVVCDFQSVGNIENQLPEDGSILKEDVIKMILTLLRQNLSDEILLQIADGNLYEYVERHLKITEKWFVIDELFEAVIRNELTAISLRIELCGDNNILSCQTFSIHIKKQDSRVEEEKEQEK